MKLQKLESIVGKELKVVAYSSVLAASMALNLSASSTIRASRISLYIDFPSTNVTSGTQSFTLLNSISS